VTTGVVSAVHRELKDESDKVLLADLVQTDAAINRGNSGGPLLNAYGQVIGINTAIRGDAQNIGFAIPVNRLRDLIPELMNPGQVSKMDVPVKLTERRTVEPPATVKVTVLASLSGADPKVVSTINGRAPADIVDAYAILLRTKPGDPVVVRTTDGRESRVATKAMPVPDAVVQAKRRLGIGVEPVTPMLAQKYGLAVEDGLFITDVARGSAAEAANLQPGDVILQLGRYRVQNLDDFSVLLQHMPAQGNVFIVVVRGQQILRGRLKLNAATSHASGPGL
jgi:serine protease Do